MLDQVANLVANILAVIAGTAITLAVLSWRFRSWKPLFHLYLKALKFSLAATTRFLWKPAFRRQGVGHLVKEQRRQDQP